MKKRSNIRQYRRLITVFCIFICLSSGAQSGNGNLSCAFEKMFRTGKSSLSEDATCNISFPFASYVTDNGWDKAAGVLTVHRVNLTSGKQDSILIPIPAEVKINFQPFICLTKEYMILTDDERSEIYRFLSEGNSYVFQNKVLLPPNSNGRKVIAITDKMFLVSSFYNYHPADNTNNSNIGIYDAENDTLINFSHPEMPCIGFSHLISSWITATDNLIALASPCGYKIRLYDSHLNPVDSIMYKPGRRWNDLEGNKLPCESDPSKIHPKILIDKLLLLQDSVSRIEKIFFVNNSTLLVSSTAENKNRRRIDLWKTSDLKKPFYTNESYALENESADTIRPADRPLPLFNAINIAFRNNKIYTFNEESFFPFQTTTVTEFNDEKNKYYEDHEPEYSIVVYRLILP